MIDTKALRNKILEAAIRGKLTEQLPEDGTAEDLYKQIQAEKHKLIKEGKIKKEKPFPPIKEDELPFDIPENWKWIRLRECGDYKKGPFGSALTKSMFVPKSDNAIKIYEQKNAIKKDWKLGNYYISNSYFNSSMKSFEVLKDDIIVSCAGTIGETYIIPEKAEHGIINQALMRIRLSKEINTHFYLFVFDSLLKGAIKSESKGSAIKNIPPFNILKNYLIPLPPLQEQNRIVEKISQLFSLLDNIDDLQNKFSCNSESLKAKLIELGIQGKLTEQLPEDGNAEVLYKQIQAEKMKLTKEGKLKKEKPLVSIKREETPYDIPYNWKWIRLADVIDVRDGTHDTPKYVKIGVPLITSKNLKNGKIDFTDVKNISYEDSYTINKRSGVKTNDILFAMIGTIGNPVLVTDKVCNFSIKNVALFKDFHGNINMYYIRYFLLSAQNNMKSEANGGVQDFVSLSYLRNYLLPLPPLAEQNRIVEKLNSLFGLCDSLK